MSKRVNGKRGNRVAKRVPRREQPCKVRGGAKPGAGVYGLRDLWMRL